MSKRTSTTTEPKAEICLYGASSCGFGYLASMKGRPGFFGNGEPDANRSATDALWLGLIDLRDAGVRGVVVVHAPGGERSARVELRSRRPGSLPTFGELEWAPASVVYVNASIADGAR